MNRTYNTICFCRETYKEYYEYSGKKEVNESRMWDDIKDFLRIACINEYQIKITDDGCTVIIEYDYQNPEMCYASLEWVGENDYVVREEDRAVSDDSEVNPVG